MSVPKYCCEVEPKNMPDMVIRQTAHWFGQYPSQCSNCECDAPSFLSGSEWKESKTPYCPNCGAKMENTDGEDGDGE